jgi:hypothetical protein
MTNKPLAPMTHAAKSVLSYAMRECGPAVFEAMREFIDIDRRIEWLNKNAPLDINPSMSSEAIMAVLDA